jgi:hypothetical protein
MATVRGWQESRRGRIFLLQIGSLSILTLLEFHFESWAAARRFFAEALCLSQQNI